MSAGTITSTASASYADDPWYARRWWTLAALCLSLLVIVMDNTILNVAIPRLVEELHASNSQLQWIIDSYTIVFAGLLLTTGSLGDRFGRKRLLTIGIILFGIGSAASAMQTTAEGLILTRAFMGIGGAMIMPSTLSILTNVFRDPRERGKAIGIWAAFSGIGIVAGPLVGGLLLRHFSWNSVFWVNIPIGITALIAGHYFIPESKNPEEGDLDPLGAVLSIAGLVCLLFGIIEAPSKGWSDPSVVTGLVLGVVIIGAFIGWELYNDTPMLDVRFYENPRFSAANAAVTLSTFALFGSLFLMTQYWQFVKGYEPLAVGVRLIPYAAAMMTVAPMSARLVQRFGTKKVMVAGLVIASGSFFGLSMLHADSSYPRAIINMMFNGIGIGLTMPPATESIMGSLPRNKAGVGSAVNDTTRQVGGALGVAVIGSIVAATYSDRIMSALGGIGLSQSDLSESASSLGNAFNVAATNVEKAPQIVAESRDAFIAGMSNGLKVSALILLLAAALTMAFLPARAADKDFEEIQADRLAARNAQGGSNDISLADA
jgi:EmrB/QacA subfamily drug resistance transporter